jgi:hypothetical protein
MSPAGRPLRSVAAPMSGEAGRATIVGESLGHGEADPEALVGPVKTSAKPPETPAEGWVASGTLPSTLSLGA